MNLTNVFIVLHAFPLFASAQTQTRAQGDDASRRRLSTYQAYPHGCPAGTSPITTESECNTAWGQNLFPGAGYGTITSQFESCRCSWHSVQNRVRFNNGSCSQGSYSQHRRAICKVNPPTAPPTVTPTKYPTQAPTTLEPTAAPIAAPWVIAFLNMTADFDVASDTELEFNYEVGRGREHESILLQKDCIANITGITISTNATRVNKNATMDYLSVKHDIPKDEIVNSSIWNSSSKEIELCQIVKLTLFDADDLGKMVIAEEVRKAIIKVDLLAGFNLTSNLGAGAIENATSTANFASYLEVCQCESSSFGCISAPLAPNEELHVCAKSTSSDVNIDRLTKMNIAQDQGEFEVVKNGVPMIPSISSIDYVSSENGVRLSTFVPVNLFDFAANKKVIIYGTIEMKLVGSGRRLRAITGDGPTSLSESEEATYEIQIELSEEAGPGPEVQISAASVGRVLGVRAVFWGVVMVLYVVLSVV